MLYPDDSDEETEAEKARDQRGDVIGDNDIVQRVEWDADDGGGGMKVYVRGVQASVWASFLECIYTGEFVIFFVTLPLIIHPRLLSSVSFRAFR